MKDPTEILNSFAESTPLITEADIARRRELRRTKYDDVLMENALSWAKKAKCRSIQVGAVLAIEGRTIMSGYNGTVMGANNCCEENNEGMDPADTSKKPRIIHAELNAIIFCAKKGIATEGATLYVTHNPCSVCAALVAQAGIKRVVYNKLFKDEGGIADLKEYGILVNQFGDADFVSDDQALDQHITEEGTDIYAELSQDGKFDLNKDLDSITEEDLAHFTDDDLAVNAPMSDKEAQAGFEDLNKLIEAKLDAKPAPPKKPKKARNHKRHRSLSSIRSLHDLSWSSEDDSDKKKKEEDE